MADVFSAKIETNGGDYWNEAHLGTCETVARNFCEDIYMLRRPRLGDKITGVSLYKGQKFVDSFDGEWVMTVQGIG